MVEKLLRLAAPPQPLDASDALAVAICHIHTSATQTRMQKSCIGVDGRPDSAEIHVKKASDPGRSRFRFRLHTCCASPMLRTDSGSHFFLEER
jgi:hypothetical protein